jgi:ferrous iron transport protein A
MSMLTLDQLKDGQAATVTALRHDGDVSVRLMEMGLFEGVRVQVLRRAPLGDPIEVQLGDYRLSLRKSEAQAVDVTP